MFERGLESEPVGGEILFGGGGGFNEFQVIIGVHRLSSGGEGGGTLIFSAYVGSDPASTVQPQNISGISSTPKKYLKFLQPQKISQFCTLTLKKTLN